MSINFIKAIAKKKPDQAAHNAFIRYGPGKFEKEDFIIKKMGKKIKIYGSFEYVNVLVRFVASLCSGKISVDAAVPAIKDISGRLKDNGIEYEEGRRFGKSGKLYKFKGDIEQKELLDLLDDLIDCYNLMHIRCGDRSVKLKKLETPKVGGKTDKYVVCELLVEDMDDIIKEFLFDTDADDFKEAIIKHIYQIDDVKADNDLVKKDPEEARKQALKIGTITRIVQIDGDSKESKIDFEV